MRLSTCIRRVAVTAASLGFLGVLPALAPLRCAAAGQAVQASPVPGNAAAADFAQLGRYRAENEAAERGAHGAVRVVFLGDSILDRWGRAAGVWFEHPGWVNRGIGGQTTSQMLLRERADVLALHPRAVVLEGGSNDMRLGFSPEAIRDNFASMGELAEAHHAKVFVATMTPVCDCVRPLTGLRTVGRIAALNGLIRELCRERHWTVIELNPVLADAHGLMRAEFTSDGVHPTGEGYKLLAPVVERALRRYR